METPPRVTVVDPRSPGRPVGVWAIGPSDVLEGGRERDPRDPTPRQRRSTRVVAAMGLLLVVGWYGVGQVRTDRADARAAAAAVRLWAEGLDGTRPGVVGLVLRNEGPSAVRVLTARLNRPGYGPAAGPTLRPSAVTSLSFADTATCGPHLLSSPVDGLDVTVRTAEGALVHRTVTLGPSAFRVVNGPAWRRCGYQPMEDALRFELLPVQDTRDGVVLHALVANTSVLPLTLRELMPGAGVELTTTPALPVTLPPRAYADAPDTLVGIGIRLTVRECAVPPGRGRNPFDRRSRVGTGWEYLRGWVVRDSTIRELTLPLTVRTPGGERFAPGLAQALRRSCS